MIVNRYSIGFYQTNCYLLVDENSKECAIIDPGDVCAELDKCIIDNDYIVKYIIFTHGHFDHVGGIEYYMSKFDKSLVIMDKSDVDSVLKGYDVFNPGLNNTENTVKGITSHKEDAQYKLGNEKIHIISTPGHSNGSISLYVDGILFSGDTLFEQSIGRTDFVDGDFDEIKKSIECLYKLPDNTVVYPGHGGATTILNEKINNPYVRGI